MDGRIQLLSQSLTLDELLASNDIDPEVVVRWLVSEEFIDLEDYFEDEEED